MAINGAIKMKILNFKIIFIGLISFLLTGAVLAGEVYKYPIGIPDPLITWKTTEDSGNVVHPIWGDAPDSWDIAKQSGVNAYYIDNKHPLATNTDNQFGSPEQPRKTIPETTYAAGSYVEIHGGPYDGGGQIIFTANGTAEKPVWIRGSSATDKPEITGSTIVKGQYVFLENLHYTQRGKTLSLRPHDGSSLHHAVVRNCIFEGEGVAGRNGSAISVYGESSPNRFHDIIIYNNEISYMGASYSEVDPSLGVAPENDYHGILVRSNADRVWVLNNTIHHLGGDSIQVGVASIIDTSRTSHTFIGDNDFYDNLENGVDVKEADFTLVTTNRIKNWIHHKNNGSTGIAVIVHNGAKNTWIINNRISNAASGLNITGASRDTWVIGNIIEKINHSTWDTSWDAKSLYSTGAAIHFRSGSTGGAVNNTIVDADKGVEMTTGSYTIINNILSGRAEEAAYDIQIESSVSENIISNNIIYHPTFPVNLKNSICKNCLYSQPGFINADYQTSEMAVGIAMGTSIEFLQDKFSETFGTLLDLDIALNPRVLGGIDIGAYEDPNSLKESNSVTVPVAPVIEQITLQ